MPRHIVMIACALCALLGPGCAQNARPPNTMVGIEMKRGEAWTGLSDTVISGGFRVVTLDTPIDEKLLQQIGVLFINSPVSSYDDQELTAIANFVKSGGGLLCSGQAWSWVSKEYNNQPLNSYPLNKLGSQFGFEITGLHIGAPAELDQDFLAGFGNITHTDWWPSQIKLKSRDSQMIIRDAELRGMAGLINYGQGRIAVFGHGMMLKDNPAVLKRTLSYLSRMP